MKRKVISMILMLSILLTSLPIYAFAKTTEIKEEEVTENVSAEEQSYYLGESTDERYYDIKEFLCSDGNITRVAYTTDVNYPTSDGWEEIDMNMIYKTGQKNILGNIHNGI